MPGGGLRTCPNCPDGGEPWPRYKIRVYAIDDGNDNEENASFVEFLFFGALDEQIAGITADCASANKTGRIDYLPPELEQLPSKIFILTAVTQEESLKSDFYKFQVKAVEHVQIEEPIPTLPMLNIPTIPTASEPANTDAITTPATTEYNQGESLSPTMKDGKSQDNTSTSQQRKRSDSKDEVSTSDSKKRHVTKQLFTAINDEEKAGNEQPK
ncbi:hypothetical protein ZWY2020_027079 [Hordeum vulgare]|nr:hypothetical protein ZWY2020_027079 [Hordeum vulgare]